MDERQERRAGLRRAGARAVRIGQVAGTGLIAVLCAGALAPIMTTGAEIGALGVAVSGLVGSVGGNVAADVLTAVANRLQGRNDAAVLDPEVVERALADAVNKALAGGGAAGTAMRELAAAILRETGAIQAVLDGAASADPQAATALATGLAALGRQFAEFAAEAGQLRTATAALQQELIVAAAERREVAARDARLALLAGLLREALEAPPAGSPPGESAVWPSCPYSGLAPFGEQDAPIFFGRRQMTRRLVHTVAERARAGGLLVMLGASGAGKSSLLHAGLIPALARDGLRPGSGSWPVRVITPGADPLADLAAPLAALSGGDSREILQTLRVAPQRAADIAAQVMSSYAQAGSGARPVLVLAVDQFENLFHAAPDSRALFLQALAALAAPRPGLSGSSGPVAVVLAAVRGDYLDQAVVEPAVSEAVTAGVFVVEPMTRAQLRQAIEGPAAEAGVPIEARLVATILGEAFPASGSTREQVLPLVSQAMAETWRARRGKALTLRAYHNAGGLSDAADRSAQQVYDGLDDTQRKAARAMFMLLTTVSVDGRVARRTAGRTELHEAAGLDAVAGNAVIDAFTERRLLVAERDGMAICHDVLLDAWLLLREWLHGDVADRVLYSELITDAQAWQDQQHDLYGPLRLAVVGQAALRWTDNPARYPQLPKAARNFLTASQRSARRAVRLRKIVTTALILLVVATFGFGVAAQHSAAQARDAAQEAQAQHRVALSRQLAADSSAERSDPVLAQQLALSAWAVAPTLEANRQMSNLLADDGRAGVIRTPSTINTVAFSPDGSIMAAGGNDGMVRLRSTDSGQVGITITDTTNSVRSGVRSVVFSPDGQSLAVGADDGTVRLWDPHTGRLLTTITDIQDIKESLIGVTSVAFNRDGTSMAVGAGDGIVRLWNPANGQPRATILTRHRAGLSVAFSPNGRTLAVGDDAEDTVQLWNPESSQLLATVSSINTTGKAVTVGAVAFSPDGSTLAVAVSDGTVRLCDPGSGQIRRIITDDSDSKNATSRLATSVVFSKDGTTLAVGSGDGKIRFWNPDTRLQTLPTISDTTDDEFSGVTAIALSPPDGNTLAAGGGDGTIRLWDLNSGTPRTVVADTIPADRGVRSVAISRNGTVAVGVDDGKIRLWHPGSNQPQPVITTITDTTSITDPENTMNGGVTSVAFSPDGGTLAAGAGDGTVKLWDPETRELKVTITDTHELPQAAMRNLHLYIGGVSSIAFTPNGKTLAVGAGDGTVKLWDTKTGQSQIVITDSTDIMFVGGVRSVAFSPDGQTLAVGAGNGTVKLWNRDNGKLRASITAVDSGLGGARSVTFSPNGETLAVGYFDGKVSLWDMKTGRHRITITATSLINDLIDNGVTSVVYSPNGRTLAIGAVDGTLQLWDPETGQLHATVTDTSDTNSGVTSVAFSPDGRSVTAAAVDGHVTQWPLTPFYDLPRQLCLNVGALSPINWFKFARGEIQPHECRV